MPNLIDIARSTAAEIARRQAELSADQARFYDLLVDRVCDQALSYAEFVNVMNLITIQRVSEGKTSRPDYWLDPTEDLYWQIRNQNCSRFFADPGALTNGIQALVPEFCKKSVEGVNRILRRAHLEWQREQLQADQVPKELTAEELTALCGPALPDSSSPPATNGGGPVAERGTRALARGASSRAGNGIPAALAIGLGGIAFTAIAIQLLTKDS